MAVVDQLTSNMTELLNLSGDCGRDLTDQDLQTIEYFRFIICGLGFSTLSVLGLLGNIMSLFILSSRKMKNLFNYLLSSLCVADTVFLVSNVLVLPFHFSPSLEVGHLGFLFPLLESLVHFSLSASIFLIISITIERWQTVCFPFSYQERTSDLRMTIISHLVPVLLLSFLFNITKFISISPFGPDLQKIPQYLKFILFFQAFHPLTTTGLAPFCILVFLNYKIYAQMRETKKFYRPGSKRSKEFILARTMMALVLVFLVLNTPRLILGLIEVTQLPRVEACYEAGLDYYIKKETYILDLLARFLVIINSSVNFVIYCLVGSQFRTELSTIVKKYFGRWKKERENGNVPIQGEVALHEAASCESQATRLTLTSLNLSASNKPTVLEG